MKRLSITILLLAAVLFLFSCAAKQLSLPQFDAKQFDTDLYQSKVDTFLILFDASSSMKELCQGNQKLGVARALAQRMNQIIPELGQDAALRSIGHSSAVSDKPTALLYGIEQYNSGALAGQLKKISEPGGLTPLCSGFKAVKEDLKGLYGKKNAVIIISDGEADKDNIIKNAQSLKDEFGESVCFYPIQVGESAKGTELLKQIADIGCGFYSHAKDLIGGSGMADFVEKVLLEEKPPQLPIDSDNDGIPDNYDKCLNTPKYARVNAEGCWVLNDILFNTNNSKLDLSANYILDEIVYVLERNPGLTIDISGYTDNVGSFDYNVNLSQTRADAVKAYLVSKGIVESRLNAKGFGPNNPAESNDTEEGRAMNRRVELKAN